MNHAARHFTAISWAAIEGGAIEKDRLVFTGSGALPSVFPVTEFASAAIATAGLAIAALLREAAGREAVVTVDSRLSSFWFNSSIRPIGWTLSPAWDSIAGDYAAHDGWIRLHTNAPRHRAAAIRVLGAVETKEDAARFVARWPKADLEAAVIEAGGCAAEMRTVDEWRRHPQGRAVAAEPLVQVEAGDSAPAPAWSVQPDRPLDGVRVLDLTRVLAGPIASRFLAAYGAEVLRIDPPGWEEPGVVPEVTLGKRCARLDLHDPADRVTFTALLSRADIILHGYRPGALDRLGFGAATRRELSPGIIDVGLDAYGWSGPWATRRGFDSLVQMSTGIADAGMQHSNAKRPTPLPVQALDHATGYLMAAAAICAVTNRLRRGRGTQARFSLARTAELVVAHGRQQGESLLAAETEADLSAGIESTEWGNARRLAVPLHISGTPMRWTLPAGSLGSSVPRWTDV